MTSSSLVVVDTNVLLSASEATRADHRSAVTFLDSDPRELAVTPQILREYLVVATRPAELNGVALPVQVAAANVDRLLEALHLLPEDSTTVTRLRQLVDDVPTSGRQIHDANILATALAHGASAIVTSDSRHFARFADVIEIEALA